MRYQAAPRPVTNIISDLGQFLSPDALAIIVGAYIWANKTNHAAGNWEYYALKPNRAMNDRYIPSNLINSASILGASGDIGLLNSRPDRGLELGEFDDPHRCILR